MDGNRVQQQIAIYMTSKKLVEFNDKLKPAPVEYYAHIHAQGEKLGDVKCGRSCIGMVLQDYSNGTGNKTIRVTANLSPEFFAYALSRVTMSVERFDFVEDKIFGEPDASGMSMVTKTAIKRASIGPDGKPRNYPWCIIVENGRGVKERTQNGGVHMKKGSYRKERSVFVNINDYDFFCLMTQVCRYIEAWELTNGPKCIRNAAQLLELQRTTASGK